LQAFKVRRRECRRKPPVKRDGDAAGRQVRRGNASPAQRGQPKAGQRLLQPRLDLRRGRPRFSRPKITSFSTVVASSCAAGFWNTIPARSVSCHSGIVAVGNASIHTAPRISLR